MQDSPPRLPSWGGEDFLDVEVRVWQLLLQLIPVPQRVQGQFSREWDGRPGLKGRLILPDVHYPGPKLGMELWGHPHQVLQFLRSLDFQLGGIDCDVPQLAEGLLKGPHLQLQLGQ
jgi:hypothetical protein